MQAVVHLYEALGGGWIEAPDDRTQRFVADAPATVTRRETREW
jgi:hypothetical protein